MSFIKLFDDNGFIGQFDLPAHIISNNHIYKLKYAIKKGGNGVVFVASKMDGFNESNEQYAIKFLKQLDGVRVDRFNNEVRVLRELSDPHIASYFDSGTLDVNNHSVPWVIQSLGGDNLRLEVENNGSLSIETLKKVIPNICQALQHIHSKGFIHRDIKPDNFVWKTNAKDGVFMIDFGIAKRTSEDVSARPLDNFTQHMEFVGPVFFSSPELIAYASNKNHAVDYRSDIFQLGKVIWYLATGKISAGIPSKRDCPLGGKIRDLVLEMIEDNPEDRLSSLQEVGSTIASL